ncbi:big defensin-like [Ruditapes philippinarum]|uniref:big defensin-like n=1 Tax=Ruditapes philippinarum TaxID=129788 RepID=UPI00295B6056|nr:big defensin-like [Ruditapes philippinarum]
MDKRTVYFVFYVFLLTMTTPALCLKQQLEKELLTKEEQPSVKLARQSRQAQIALPIAAYAGMAVAPYVFVALVAAYGIHVVRQYNIRKKSGWSIPCANNRGWCRPTCRFYEYIDRYHSDICGGNSCCRSRIR